eukprot:m.18392 g.18392  ORF g.18392 m.18392 type:complete len:166 (-) comp10801_c0_seq2:82-579(-)
MAVSTHADTVLARPVPYHERSSRQMLLSKRESCPTFGQTATCVFHQLNGLLVLCLYTEEKTSITINKVAFAMAPITVSGKRKKGAKKIKPGATIATIAVTKADGYTCEVAIASPCFGFILEINDLLEDQPQLILDDPYNRGYLAIMSINAKESDRIGNELQPFPP